MFLRGVMAMSVFMAMDMGVPCHGRGAGIRMTGWRMTGLAMFLGIIMAMVIFMAMDMGVACHGRGHAMSVVRNIVIAMSLPWPCHG